MAPFDETQHSLLIKQEVEILKRESAVPPSPLLCDAVLDLLPAGSRGRRVGDSGKEEGQLLLRGRSV